MFLKEWLNAQTIQDGYSLRGWQTHIYLDNGTDSFFFKCVFVHVNITHRAFSCDSWINLEDAWEDTAFRFDFQLKVRGGGSSFHGKESYFITFLWFHWRGKLSIMENSQDLGSNLGHKIQNICGFVVVIALVTIVASRSLPSVPEGRPFFPNSI